MFYNILSKINDQDVTVCQIGWLDNQFFCDIPKRLAEFYFNDNIAFEQPVEDYEKILLANVQQLFGFEIRSVVDYYDKMSNGKYHEKNSILHKLAMCYIQPNFMVMRPLLMFLENCLVFDLESYRHMHHQRHAQ